ncbi:phosphoglycolate phosphatase [Virgibacillus pantothenticus]|uniref:HAD-IA family hydrolase n=1 Tax=Virgibacillus pantothenticus TaxID=1473 RepID=UPI001B26A172|nr:HAD-IA family hydrolase [Virgibacillus pantothenticus]GIP63950.1 phosphoglycolate phosphatase [Virgibacillus pantothenticus]
MHLLWDFDGTLINTYPSYTKCFKQVLTKTATENEIYRQLKKSFSHAIAYFQMTKEQEVEVRRLVDNMKPEEVEPFPGLEGVLQAAEVNVIMTHKDRKNVERILGYHGLTSYFKDMVTSDDQFPRKPDSSSYAYLHNKHQIDVAIGDREIDLLPAKELGIKTCSFQNKQADADFHISNYHAFLDTVKI